MMEVVYTVHEDDHSYETFDAEVAETYSRMGLRVTAEVRHD